jgi:hypothetical protein
MEDDHTSGRPRVLIEVVEWAVGEATAGAFRTAGWDAAVCSGPGAHALHCPLIAQEGCDKVADADLVVTRISLDDVRNRALIRMLGERAAVVPVIVETPTPTAVRYRQDLVGCTVVPYPARTAQLVEAANEALGPRAPDQPS